jgi:hypothetical protein
VELNSSYTIKTTGVRDVTGAAARATCSSWKTRSETGELKRNSASRRTGTGASTVRKVRAGGATR